MGGGLGCIVGVEGKLPNNWLVNVDERPSTSPFPKKYLSGASPTVRGTDLHDLEMTKTRKEHRYTLMPIKCHPQADAHLEQRTYAVEVKGVSWPEDQWQGDRVAGGRYPNAHNRPTNLPISTNKMPLKLSVIWYVELQTHSYLKWN